MSSELIARSDHLTFTKPCEFYFPVNNSVQMPTKDWEFSAQDSELLVHSVYYSDSMITTYSTLAIDGAACDRPIIGVRYDADPQTPLKSRVTAIHDAHDHYSELEAAGGVMLVNSGDELINGINFYLAHPEADREGRKRITHTQIEFTDGLNGKRAADAIKTTLFSLAAQGATSEGEALRLEPPTPSTSSFS
jgi:hypothetical protein